MKKILFVFIALISVFAMSSCDDKTLCVGRWVSEDLTSDETNGKIYLTIRENGHTTLALKGSVDTETDGISMNVAFTVEVDGTWDVSLGILDLNFSPDNVRYSIDKIDAGDEDVNALIQIALSDPDTKNEIMKEFEKELDIDEFSGSSEIDFRGDNTMLLTIDDGEILTFRRM